MVFSTVSEPVFPSETEAITLAFNSKPRGWHADGDGDYEEFWTLSTWPRSGAFAAVVSSARTRNFVLA